MTTKKNDPVSLPFGLAFSEAWEEWLQYRRERRLPAYKPTGLKKTFAGIVRDSGDSETTAIEMINQAMEKNWQGIFPLTKNNVKNGTHNQISRQNAGAYELLGKLKSDLGLNP